MSPESILSELQARALLPPAQAARIRADEAQRPFSLHQELRLLLYLGIVLLSGGVGVLLYQHIDQIGHGVIVAGIALAMLAAFAHAYRRRPPFTWAEVPRQGFLADYALLLGCLLFLALETYLQVQYAVFGSRYGLATLLPAGLFLPLAYRFDHRGVLAMAITALASWVGVSVAPLSAYSLNDFFAARLTVAALLFGLALIAAGFLSEYLRRKAHFAFTYLSLGSNLLLIAATAAMFEAYAQPVLPPALAALLIIGVSAGLIWYARRAHSYLFLLMGALYGYVAVTYLLFSQAFSHASEGVFVLAMLYFILSTGGIVLFFINLKKLVRGA